VNKQEKEGSHCSFGDSFMVCQPICSVRTSSAETAVVKSDQCNTNDEPEPMRISLDFAKSDTEEEMAVQEELDGNYESPLVTDSEQAASSS